MRKSSQMLAAAVVAMAMSAAAANAAEWGDLTGKFVFDGTPPAATKVQINKDMQCCNVPHENESLVVGADGGIANVIIYVRTPKAPVAPSYEASAKDKVVFDNKTCRFDPHVLPIRLTQTLEVKNSDNCGHNTNVTPLGDKAFNQLLSPQGNLTHLFGRQQNIPIKVVCNIHPWMEGYILPRDNPYTAVSAADGTFSLKELPAQELEFQVWQEKAGFVDTPKWPKGKFKLKIKAGENDLGVIKLPAALFAKK